MLKFKAERKATEIGSVINHTKPLLIPTGCTIIIGLNLACCKAYPEAIQMNVSIEKNLKGEQSMEFDKRLQSACWIGVPESAYPEGKGDFGKVQTAWFRTEFDADSPSAFTLLMSATSRYKLWMNGKRVSTGPCKGVKGAVYYDEWDLSAHLANGRNELLVMVVYYPMPAYGLGPQGGPLSVISHIQGPWLLASGVMTPPSGISKEILTTGTHAWEVSLDSAYTWVFQNYLGYTATGPYEDVEGRQLPLYREHQDAMDWVAPVKGYEAYYTCFGEGTPLPLRARIIPYLEENKKDFACEITRTKDSDNRISFQNSDHVIIPPGRKGVVLLDTRELTTGFFQLAVKGGAGSTVSIRYAESASRKGTGQYDEKGVRDDFEHYDFRGYQDIYRPAGGDERYEPFHFRTFRFILLEVETRSEALTLFKPHYLEVVYPMKDVTLIQSESPTISALWNISMNTLKRCMHETYEDCPYYEQVQYVLDSRLEALYTYSLSGHHLLAKKALQEFHEGKRPDGLVNAREPSTAPNVIPSFSLHWIMMLEEYFVQTADLAFAKSVLPTVDGILAWFEGRADANGLIGKSEFWDFIDWVDGWVNERGQPNGTPTAMNEGSSTVLSLMLSAALKAAARLHQLFKHEDMADAYNQWSGKLNACIRQLCYSAEKGLFREGPSFEDYSQHTQVWAVLSGAVSMEEGKSLMEKMMAFKDIKLCSYAACYFLFRAMEATGLYAHTEALWKPWVDAIDQNLTTWPEDFTNQRSDCHGWSALPLYEFTACLLGVRPLKAGWKGIRVKPYYILTPNLSGEIVTPVGKVKVVWELRDNGVELTVESPAGIPLEIVLPDESFVRSEAGGAFTRFCSL